MLKRESLAEATPANVEPPTVPDAREALLAINPAGEFLAAGSGSLFPDEVRYTTEPENNGGMLNHFQGLERLHSGHLALSGSDWRKDGGSHLFLIGMDSRFDRGPFTSNLVRAEEPPAEDRVVQAVRLDDELWHAGGMDSLGHVLAVPTEHGQLGSLARIATGADRTGPQRSKVYFLDVTNPRGPKVFPGTIERPTTKGGAVALTRLPNGFYLCGVWSDSDEPKGAFPRRMDFYLSRSAEFDGRFRQEPEQLARWEPDDTNPESWAGSFQAVKFLWDEKPQLYLMGFHEHHGHWAQLYEVEIDGMDEEPGNDGGVGTVTVRRIAQQDFRCPMDFSDMRGASGAFLEDGLLYVYSSAQFRTSSGVIRFSEFRPPMAPYEEPVDGLDEAWIELYGSQEFSGDSLTLRDISDEDSDFSNYRDVHVRGRGFGDRVRSARYQLPAGAVYRMYKDHGFRKPLLDLTGTGELVELPGLAEADEEISSSKLISPTRSP